MARSKSRALPHHVKERLRHQNLQKILENVANYVPKPTTNKKETKAKKLRRVVLYMKYLIHKKEQLFKSKPKAIKKITKCQDIVTKTNVTVPELSYVHKPKSKRAHIVFLTRSDTSRNNHEDTQIQTEQKSSDTEKEQEIHAVKNTVNILNKSNPKNRLSCDNGLELFDEKPDKSAADINDRYIPNMEMEKLSDYDMDLWKEDYSTISMINTKRKVEKAGRNDITGSQVLTEGEKCFMDGKESIICELGRNETNLERYIQEFSRDLEKIQGNYSPHKKMSLSNKLESSCADIYNYKNDANFISSYKKLTSSIEKSSSKNREKSHSFNESETLKNDHSGYEVQMDKNPLVKQPLFLQSSNNFSSGETGAFTYLNNFEMPHSFNNSALQKNDQQCCAVKTDQHQDSKLKMFAQRPYNFSPDFFSSEESGTLTSFHSFESQSDRPNNCNDEMGTRQFSKHPSFSQSSDNFSSDIFSSGESGTLMSSNEYLLGENEHIGFKDIQYPCSIESPTDSLRPEYVIDEDKYDYSLTPPQRNCDTISSPDIFCDMKQDIPHISDFSSGNILSKSSNKNSASLAANSERFLEYNIHEPNYNIPVIHDAAYNYIDSRFINYFGMNNYPQSLPFNIPPFAQVGTYPTLNKGVTRYCNIVPNDEDYIMGNYTCKKANDFNLSMYVNEDVENYLDAPIKQEIGESFLPPEELSYSLNSFTDSGYCWSQKD